MMPRIDAQTQVAGAIAESIAVKKALLQTAVPQITEAAAMISASLASGGTLILFGNGGSAGDAQHIAAELVGRFEAERRPYPAIALTTNASSMTAIANDYGYDRTFSRQVAAFAKTGDVAVGISTSGNSRNVVEGVKAAREIGAKTVGLTGEKGGALAGLCDLCLKVPSANTARIQESHIMIGHLLCMLVEQTLILQR